MRIAGMRGSREQGKIVGKLLVEAKIGGRELASPGINDCAVLAVAIHPQRPSHASCRPIELAKDQQVIYLRHVMVFELEAQSPVSVSISRKHQNTAGVAVQAVHHVQGERSDADRVASALSAFTH